MPISEGAVYRAGDVVVVPFPYSDRFAQKRRPALVVSNGELHAQGLVWLAMITTAKLSSQTYDVEIAGLAEAGLSAVSIVRPTKIACVEPLRILRKAGALGEPQIKAIQKVMRTFLRGRPATFPNAS